MKYIIYHEVAPGVACPDGLASAWVTSKAIGEATLVGRMYNDERAWPFEPLAGDELYFVDFSLPAAEFESIIEGVEITVLDHHKTARENLANLSDRITQRFNMNLCGATMCWEYFFPEKPVPAFLNYIQDRDLWDHKLESTAEVHAAYAKLGRTFELYDKLASMSQAEFLEFMVPIGRPAVEERKAKVEAIAQRQELATVAGHDGVMIVKLAEDGSEDGLTSDVCQAMYLQHPEVPFVACWVPSSGTWSLRSNKDGNNTDVGEIAKANGGGGHRNAAGFKVTKARLSGNEN